MAIATLAVVASVFSINFGINYIPISGQLSEARASLPVPMAPLASNIETARIDVKKVTVEKVMLEPNVCTMLYKALDAAKSNEDLVQIVVALKMDENDARDELDLIGSFEEARESLREQVDIDCKPQNADEKPQQSDEAADSQE